MSNSLKGEAVKGSDIAAYIEGLGGVATSGQLKKAGFTPGSIDYSLKCGLIDRLTRGVDCSMDMFEDDFAAVCARWKKSIISHGSALFLEGLSDRVP